MNRLELQVLAVVSRIPNASDAPWEDAAPAYLGSPSPVTRADSSGGGHATQVGEPTAGDESDATPLA